MTLDYFYGQAGKLFSFYRIPKALFQEQRFQNLSTDAKTLYGILLDRMSLSVKNEWFDKQGRVFIIFTIEDVKRALCCADNKATKLLRELENFGLIERKRRGLGKPSLVYVKNFSSDLSNERVQNRENHESGSPKNACQDPPKSRCNKNKKSKTERNNTNPILSDELEKMKNRKLLEEYFSRSLEMHMTDYSKITALYSRLSVGDEDRDGGESNSIQNQKIFLENYARGQHLTNIRHYIDDDESGRFFDRSAYSRMMDDVENGKIGVCIMKDLTRWGRDYLQVGNAMEIFRRNNVRFIAVNNGIDSEKPDTLEFAPFINIMSEWYAKDISKKVKTGIKTKGMSGKPIVTEAPYGYIKAPDNKDFWIIDEEAAEVVRLIFRLFLDGKNRNQIAVYLTQEQIPSPTFYMKDRGRGTCKNKTLNEDNRCKWNKATLTNILTRQEYCGDVVNFKTTKHFRDKHNHYVDRSQWHITENVHEPIISRSDFETVQRILENAPVRRPNGDGEIHPLSGLLFCKDCGAKMHIRIDYRNGGKRHVAYCSEYHKGKAKNPKCNSPHIMDADLLMQTIAEVLKKIEDYSISNRAEFEALVKKNLAMQQTDQTKKQQKRIPQITTRLEQIDKVLNKLYEDNALGTIPQDRYEQMSQKYSEEYYSLKAELEQLREQLSAFENAGGRAQKFVKLIDRYADFTDLTPTILNEFISRIEVHERDKKRAKQAIQHIGIYFNHIGRFENELTQLAEPTEQEIRQMREEIEEARKEKSRAYHRNYSREYRARNLEKQREYDRIKAREYRAKKKAQAAAAPLAP